MDGITSAIQSKTMWGALITTLCSVLMLFGKDTTGLDSNAMAGYIVNGIGAITGLYTMYARVVAKDKIVSVLPQK